jgi:hypothetical protein
MAGHATATFAGPDHRDGVVTPTKCLVCDVPTVLLAVTGCSSVYDDTCPHRTTTTNNNNNGPAPQAEPCGPA